MKKLHTKFRHWWTDILLDWALQTAPKDTDRGRKVRDMVAAYDSLK